MIELVFGESTGGALKVAKSRKQGDRIVVGIAGFDGKEQYEAKEPRYWPGITMKGSSEDVAVLALVLDIGDVSEMDTDMNSRKRAFDDLFADFHRVSDETWDRNQHTLIRLHEAKATMEPVRIWICDSDPGELCGLYFVCNFMLDSKTPLSVVRVPEIIEKDNIISIFHSAGEIKPELFGALAKYEESICESQRRYYADLWRDLVHENAPLRAVINGSLIGVPEYFYDFALQANIPDGEIKVGQLIGKTLIQISGIGDRWLFLRIQAMLKSGELIMVSAGTGDHPYSQVVKRGK